MKKVHYTGTYKLENVFNGEGCTLIETTLTNPTSAGSGSSTDISLIPPYVHTSMWFRKYILM